MIGLLDILWDEDFKARAELVRGFDIKDQDLECFISPVINMLLRKNAINDFIKEKCVPQIKEQLNDSSPHGYILLAKESEIKEVFPSLDWVIPYQVYIKLYLEELYHIKGRIYLSESLETTIIGIKPQDVEDVLANMED